LPDQTQRVPRRDIPNQFVAVEVELAFQCLMLRVEVFGSCSRKYIRITMPKKIEMAGTSASIPSSVRSNLAVPTYMRFSGLTPQFSRRAPTHVIWHFIHHGPLQLLVMRRAGADRVHG
jgi:hypothetical protein